MLVILAMTYKNSGQYYDARWPLEYAVCDLNLSKWRSLVEFYKIEDDARDVIRGCLEGFHQGIPDHKLGNRRWFTPFSHEEVFEKIGFF